jgi:hypothetical protein
MLGVLAYGYDPLFKRKVTEYGQKLNVNPVLMVQGIHEEGIDGLKEIRILGKDYFHRVVQRTSEFCIIEGNHNSLASLPVICWSSSYEYRLLLYFFFDLERASLDDLIPTLVYLAFAAIRLIPSTNTTLINGVYGCV